MAKTVERLGQDLGRLAGHRGRLREPVPDTRPDPDAGRQVALLEASRVAPGSAQDALLDALDADVDTELRAVLRELNGGVDVDPDEDPTLADLTRPPVRPRTAR